jgi:sugar lactone lactonase YvrE
MSSKSRFIAVAGTVLLAACAQEEEPSMPAAEPETAAPAPAPTPEPAAAPVASGMTMPDVIEVERGGFIPEGIEYDQANGRFLTGSLAEGTIFEIGTDGSLMPFVMDPELVSSVGIEADEPRDRLLVCNSDSSVFEGTSMGQAKLGVYSLTTGERLAMVDMGAMVPDGDVFFANDVTVADDGTVYATDTRQNVVYAVDTEYEASVFYSFPDTEGLALNGIVYHPDGYLLIADLGNGAIYKTPLADPSATAMVDLPEPVNGADGMVWRADGALAVVQNSAEDGRVTALVSSDDWASARIAGVAPHEGQATTAAAAGDDVYTVQPHFADQDPPTIHRAVFQ